MIYYDNIEFNAFLQVTDSYGLTSTDTVHIKILNAKPVISAIPSKTVAVGDLFTVENISFTDSGELDSHFLRIDWKDGDVFGREYASSPLSVSHTYTSAGTYVVEVRVTDSDNSSAVETFTIEASYRPVADAGGNSNGAYLAYEGDTVHFDAAASSDADSGDTLTFAWDLDNDGDFDDALSAEFDKVYTNDYTGSVAVKVTDSKGFFSTAYTTLTVLNRDPEIPPISDFDVNEGDTLNLADIVITDAGSQDIHTVTINWGDSVVDDLGTVASRKFSAGHVYTNPGSYSAQVTVADGDGGSVVRGFTVNAGLQTIDLEIVIADNRAVELRYNAVPGKNYDILYCDNDSVISLNKKRLWKTAGRIAGGLFIDSGDTDGFDDIPNTADDRTHPSEVAQRYYCVIQTDPVAPGQWVVSGIKYARGIVMYEGRNFVGKCGDEDTLNRTLDSRFLPGAGLMSMSTSVTFFRNGEQNDAYIFYEEGYPRMWFDAAGVNVMDDSPVPDGCGLIVTLPPGCGQVLAQKCGAVNADASVDIAVAHNDYTVVTWPYDREVTLAQSGLLESGLLAGSTSRKSDLVYFFNGQTQRYDQAVFFCNAPSVMKWKYMNLTDCNRTIKPGEAFLIRTLSISQFSNWHVARPYGSGSSLLEE